MEMNGVNLVVLSGRLLKDPEYHSGNEEKKSFTRYSIAVDRGTDTADFVSCIAFANNADFAAQYLKKGMKVVVRGRLQTGTHTNEGGQKFYNTNVVVEQHDLFSGGSEAKEKNN